MEKIIANLFPLIIFAIIIIANILKTISKSKETDPDAAIKQAKIDAILKKVQKDMKAAKGEKQKQQQEETPPPPRSQPTITPIRQQPTRPYASFERKQRDNERKQRGEEKTWPPAEKPWEPEPFIVQEEFEPEEPILPPAAPVVPIQRKEVPKRRLVAKSEDVHKAAYKLETAHADAYAIKKDVKRGLYINLNSRSEALKGIVLAEILGPPRGLKEHLI